MAVVTTSGTAVSECLSAAVEGTYSALPLVLITADRPKVYRGTGAPQAIEQVGIFSSYVEAVFDLDQTETNLDLAPLSWTRPIQINVCFQEPLLDGVIPKIEVPVTKKSGTTAGPHDNRFVTELQQFTFSFRPLVILSAIPEQDQSVVLDFLKKLGAPVYAEALSQLRGHPDLRDFEIRSGEKILSRLFQEKHCLGVLRIGGVPTVRLWRDLEDKLASLPVFSVGSNHFTGLSRAVTHFEGLARLANVTPMKQAPLQSGLKQLDLKMSTRLAKLLLKYPSSEPGLVRALSPHLGRQNLYLGNSLPIREWDLAADPEAQPARVTGNRGANGIDGQVSTFLGWSRPGAENWCLVGDLTALYDLGGPWVTSQLQASTLRIVVLNNGGGMIFQRMFGKDLFLNRHQLKFKAWAEFWGWNYSVHQEVPAEFNQGDRQIIEIEVSEQQTLESWKEWESAWTEQS